MPMEPRTNDEARTRQPGGIYALAGASDMGAIWACFMGGARTVAMAV